MIKLVLIPLIALSGCSTFTNQGFRETIRTVEWSEPDEAGDQYMISETVSKIRLKDFIVAAPWKGKAGTDHSISYNSTGPDQWTITFGGTNELEGGDLSEVIEAAEKAMIKGVIEGIKGGI